MAPHHAAPAARAESTRMRRADLLRALDSSAPSTLTRKSPMPSVRRHSAPSPVAVRFSNRPLAVAWWAAASLLGACGGAPATPSDGAVPAASAPAADARVEATPLDTSLTPEAVTAGCADVEAKMDARLAEILAVPAANRTFETSFGGLEAAYQVFNETASRLHFLKDIHQDAKVREAAAACQERSGKYVVGLSARKDLYEALKGYLAHAGATAPHDAEQKRLIELTMRDFRRAGLELPDDARKRLVDLRQRLTELETRYHQNLGEDKTRLEFPVADLEGLPADFIARHEKTADGSKVILTVKYPDYFPVMENAKKESVRREMLKAFNNRGGVQNVALLNEATKLRAEAAALLGYATHADFVAEPNMAKTAKTIEDFLTRMRAGMKPGLDAYTEKMLALKRAETGDPKAVFNAWDTRYYLNQVRKRDFALDDEEVRTYFPAPKVLAGMYEVYSKLFGVRFVEVPGVQTWAEGVKLYDVRDAATDATLARFYVDMYPREGKYGHAACFNFAPGHQTPKGYRAPMSALVVNFEPPTAGKPAHLSMDEVETLFHEFGHVMHESLTVARYATQAGTSSARDFVEAPSQMLENWVYQPEILAMLSEDPKNPGQPMPAELMQKIARARNYDAGVHFSRQIFLGLFDQTIHRIKPTDTPDADAVSRRLWMEIVGYPEDADTHFPASFGHMMGGYDAGYYGYLWSLVFAADMFTRFQAAGVLDPRTGREYRDRVISRGRTRDADELLRDFLGREPNEAAFLKQLGIQIP
jgi:thimet oligopeptidase